MRKGKKIIALALSALMLCTSLPVNILAAPKAKKINLTKKSIKIKEGKSFTIKSKGKATVRAKISPSKADKAIKVKTSDKSVVRVKKLNKYGYRLYAKSEGNATVTIQSLSRKSLQKKLMVNVVAEEEQKIESFAILASQSAEDKITVTFSKPVAASISASNFALKDKTGNSVVAISDVTKASDNKSAEIKALISLNKGSVYELTFTNPDDSKTYTASINASTGEVASIKLVTKSVPLNIAKKIKFSVIDTNGVDVTNTYSPFVSLTADVPAGKGYFDSATNKLTMYDASVTATIKMTYMNGSKKVEASDVVSVTSVSTETVSLKRIVSVFPLMVLAYPTMEDAINTIPERTNVTMSKNSSELAILPWFVTSDGKNILAGNAALKFTSSNPSVLDVTTSSGIGSMKAVTPGTAQVLVEVTYEGKVSKFTPLSVTVSNEESKVVRLEAKTAKLEVQKSTPTKFYFPNSIDQFDNYMFNNTDGYTFTFDSSIINPPTVAYVSPGSWDFKVDATSCTPGTYPVVLERKVNGGIAKLVYTIVVTP